MKFADLFRMFQLIYDKNDEKLLSVKCSVCSQFMVSHISK